MIPPRPRCAALLLGVAAIATFTAAGPAAALDATGSLVVAPDWRAANGTSPYASAFAVSPSATLRQDLTLKLREGGLNAEARLRVEAAEDRRPDRRGLVNQLYYDGDLGGGDAFTLGRKALSWGVGFGFRPLDVVQREDRRGLNPAPLVGVPVAAWERYTANEAWTVLIANPLTDGGRGATMRDVRAPALALRWYRLAANGDDLHAVARLSARQRLEAGAGITRAVSDAVALHAAGLYQRRVAAPRHTLIGSATTLATTDPMTEEFHAHGISAVAGVQWTGESGLGLLVEAWHDAAAWRRGDWQQFAALTARQRAVTGLAPQVAIDGNLAWSAQAFNRPNLLRDNLLLRLSYDEDQRWKYSLELLTTPADGGRVLTAGAAWQGDRHGIAAGVRLLGGAGGSAYALAPTRRMVYLQWTVALP